MPAFPDLQVGSCRLKTKGRIQHCPHTVIERRSANLRPGDSGAGSGGSAVPEASAPVAVSKSAQNQTKPAENNTVSIKHSSPWKVSAKSNSKEGSQGLAERVARHRPAPESCRERNSARQTFQPGLFHLDMRMPGRLKAELRTFGVPPS